MKKAYIGAPQGLFLPHWPPFAFPFSLLSQGLCMCYFLCLPALPSPVIR